MSIIPFIVEQFQKNQVFSALVLAAPITVLTYTARELPKNVFKWVRHTTTTSITFNSSTPGYSLIQEWVFQNIVKPRFSRSYLYETHTSFDRESYEERHHHLGLTAGYGNHLGWYEGRLANISRIQDKSDATKEFKEHLTISFLTRDRTWLSSVSDRIRDYVQKGTDDNVVWLWTFTDYWKRTRSLPIRPFSTVFTADSAKERLLAHFDTFLGQREWCHERGLPYHTGALLTGEPGTGKTSLIHAIGSALKRDLYYLNLATIQSDEKLLEAFSGRIDWSKVLLVLEDLDAASSTPTAARKSKRRRAALPPGLAKLGGTVGGEDDDDDEADQKVSLSALLNVLDGLLTPDGLVVIGTTNHPENLDPALLRPGRFDFQVELGRLDYEGFAGLAALFDKPQFAPRVKDRYQPETGATLRALLQGPEETLLAHFPETPRPEG